MKNLTILLPVLVLAACGQEPVREPAAAQTIAAGPAEPALPAPDEAVFAASFAAACPTAQPVSKSVCKRAGIGSTDAICDFGLGDDEYLRNRATITPVNGTWTIADPATTCAAGGAR